MLGTKEISTKVALFIVNKVCCSLHYLLNQAEILEFYLECKVRENKNK